MAQATSRSVRLRPRGQFWLDHLRPLAKRGQTLKAYAQTHGYRSVRCTPRARRSSAAVCSASRRHRRQHWCRYASHRWARRFACICPTASLSKSPRTSRVRPARRARMRESAVMIRPPQEGVEVWLCVEPVDFRKQITGLATLVQDRLAMDPFSAQLFGSPTAGAPSAASCTGSGADACCGKSELRGVCSELGDSPWARTYTFNVCPCWRAARRWSSQNCSRRE